MKKINEFLSKYYLAVLGVLSIGTIWALFIPGFYGASDEVHIAWLYEMDYIVRILQVPPRFVPDLSFGFGYPLFNFVFPLPYYLGEILHLIGFSLVDSIKIVFGLTMPISMWGMYVLGRKWTSPVMGMVMAVLYGYGPYRAVDLYIRGAMGELVAMMMMPWLIWAVISVTEVKQQNLKRYIYALAGGLVLAAFILSHNIAAYMFLPWVGILAVAMLVSNKEDIRHKLFGICLFFSVGIFGSMYFWLPAILESGLMKYDTVFNFTDHYPTLKQLVTPYWGYGASVPGPYDGMSFFLGFGYLGLLVVFGIMFFWSWKTWELTRKIFITWVVLMIGWAMLMMNFRSEIIWRNIPLIGQFQFPWRFLMLVTVGVPMLLIAFGKRRIWEWLGILLAVLTIIFNFGYFKPQDFLGRSDNYFLEKYIPFPVVNDLYLSQREEYLRLPVGTTQRPNMLEPVIFGYEGTVTRLTEQNRLNVVAVVESTRSATLNVNKYMFPGWRAKVDNQEMELMAGKEYGQVSLNLPAGRHLVQIWYSETLFRGLVDVFSLATMLGAVIGCCLIFTIIRRKEIK